MEFGEHDQSGVGSRQSGVSRESGVGSQSQSGVGSQSGVTSRACRLHLGSGRHDVADRRTDRAGPRATLRSANREDTAAMAKQKQDDQAGGKGKGSKPDAPRGRKGQTSGQGSTGAKKSGNRPGASGTGSKKGLKGSSSRRRSGSRSGGGQGSKGKS